MNAIVYWLPGATSRRCSRGVSSSRTCCHASSSGWMPSARDTMLDPIKQLDPSTQLDYSVGLQVRCPLPRRATGQWVSITASAPLKPLMGLGGWVSMCCPPSYTSRQLLPTSPTGEQIR